MDINAIKAAIQKTELVNSLTGKGAFEHHFITYLNGQGRIYAPLLLCYHPAATLQASKVISHFWLVEVFPLHLVGFLTVSLESTRRDRV